MCGPTVMAIASIGSTIMSTYGAYQQAKAQKQQAEYQSAVARNNQIIAERNAKEIEKQGKTEANRYRARVEQLSAEQTVGLAGQGVDVTEGTSIDLLSDTAELGEFDAKKIESNAGRQAYNARVQGMNYGAQAGLYSAQAGAINPLFEGVSTLLSTGTSAASKWQTYKGSTT